MKQKTKFAIMAMFVSIVGLVSACGADQPRPASNDSAVTNVQTITINDRYTTIFDVDHNGIALICTKGDDRMGETVSCIKK